MAWPLHAFHDATNESQAECQHQQIELLLSPIIRHEIKAIIAKQSVHYSHYLTIILLLFDLLSLPIKRYYLFQYYYPLLSYLLYAIISNTIYYTPYLRSCAPSLRVHSRTNPGYVQGSLTAQCAAQLNVLLDMHDGEQYGHTATSSSVYTLLCSLFQLLCSLFPLAEQESAGWYREICTAAQCTTIPSTMPS
jgi:hypothetical protein